MTTSLDDLSSTSQGIASEKSTEKSALKTDTIKIPPALWDRDGVDLLLLKWIGKSPDGIESTALRKKTDLTYSAISNRLVRMNELGLLQRGRRNVGRPGPAPYAYSLDGVTIEAVEAVIHERGMDLQGLEQEQVKKHATTTHAYKNNDSSSESQQPDPWEYPIEAKFDISTNSNTYSILEPINTDEPPKQDIAETSEVKSIDTEPSSTTSTTSNSDGDVLQVLAHMAQEIVALKKENVNFKEEVANLKNRLIKLEKDPQKTTRGMVNEIWNILEQTPNGKVTS